MLLSDLRVDVLDYKASQYDDNGSSSVRLFRRKLLETDEVDEVRRLERLRLSTGEGACLLIASCIRSGSTSSCARVSL